MPGALADHALDVSPREDSVGLLAERAAVEIGQCPPAPNRPLRMEQVVGKDEERFDISESLTMREDAPFVGSALDIEEYAKIAEECMKAVKRAESIRQTVLETWLLADYAVREVLSNLWGLKKFSDEESDFDLRHKLLPGFARCIGLLQRILDIQRSLPEEPVSYRLRGPLGLMWFLKEKHRVLLDRLLQVEDEYLGVYHPELVAKKPNDPLVATTVAPRVISRKRYCANKAWVEALRSLDENWFKLARRLNKARNVAAHSHDPSKILSALGCSGANAAAQAKKECVQMIETLLGIARKSASPDCERSSGSTPQSCS